MKKISVSLVFILAALLVIGSQPLLSKEQSTGSTEEMPISVRIQSEELDFADQPPIIYQGRVLVPLRKIFESVYVQAKVLWDDKGQQAIVFDQRGYRVLFKPGELQYYVIDAGDKVQRYSLDVPAMIVNGRLLIPLRVFLETFEYYVTWLPEVRWVQIEDSLPPWRKLLSRKDWQAELLAWQQQIAEEGGGCLPCLLKEEG